MTETLIEEDNLILYEIQRDGAKKVGDLTATQTAPKEVELNLSNFHGGYDCVKIEDFLNLILHNLRKELWLTP